MSDEAKQAPASPRLRDGIDVSHHQGAIVWPAVRAHGVEFAIVKVSQGDGFIDSRGWENMAGARRAGLRVGAYHFLDMDSRPGKQAALFVERIRAAGNAWAADFVALDLEDESARRLWGTDAGAFALSWLGHVEASTRLTPFVYVSPAFAARTKLGRIPELARFPLWLADWTPPADLPEPWRSSGATWTIWQHTNEGRVPGIAGPVDLNRGRLAF